MTHHSDIEEAWPTMIVTLQEQGPPYWHHEDMTYHDDAVETWLPWCHWGSMTHHDDTMETWPIMMTVWKHERTIMMALKTWPIIMTLKTWPTMMTQWRHDALWWHWRHNPSWWCFGKITSPWVTSSPQNLAFVLDWKWSRSSFIM